MHPHGSVGPLRDKKGAMWEGGIRVPGMIRWPGHTRAGGETDEPVSGVDFFPTVCAITGITAPPDRTLDGASWLPVLEGKSIQRTTPLYWQFNRASSQPRVAARLGDWKILATFDPPNMSRSHDLDEKSEREAKTAELDQFFLYNLRNDIGETTDLAETEPEKLAQAKAALTAKFLDVRADAVTWPSWKHTNGEAALIIWPDYYLKKKTAKKK